PVPAFMHPQPRGRDRYGDGRLGDTEHEASFPIELSPCRGSTRFRKDREMPEDKDQGIERDDRGQEQPADKERAQTVTSVEEKKRTEEQVRKLAEKSGF